jgi:hypothetical protein
MSVVEIKAENQIGFPRTILKQIPDSLGVTLRRVLSSRLPNHRPLEITHQRAFLSHCRPITKRHPDEGWRFAFRHRWQGALSQLQLDAGFFL